MLFLCFSSSLRQPWFFSVHFCTFCFFLHCFSFPIYIFLKFESSGEFWLCYFFIPSSLYPVPSVYPFLYSLCLILISSFPIILPSFSISFFVEVLFLSFPLQLKHDCILPSFTTLPPFLVYILLLCLLMPLNIFSSSLLSYSLASVLSFSLPLPQTHTQLFLPFFAVSTARIFLVTAPDSDGFHPFFAAAFTLTGIQSSDGQKEKRGKNKRRIKQRENKASASRKELRLTWFSARRLFKHDEDEKFERRNDESKNIVVVLLSLVVVMVVAARKMEYQKQSISGSTISISVSYSAILFSGTSLIFSSSSVILFTFFPLLFISLPLSFALTITLNESIKLKINIDVRDDKPEYRIWKEL